MKKIGIIILNYKTYQDTERLVNEINSQTSSFDIFIQVVDNASPNDSFDCLKESLGHYENVNVSLAESNGGFAIGNNYGLWLLESWKPDYALILNNDVHFDLSVLDCLDEMYQKLNNPGAIAPLQKLPNNQYAIFNSLKCNTFLDDVLAYSRIAARMRKPHRYGSNTEFANVQQVDIIPGCFIFIDYDLFKHIGFFDESTFLFCEERFLYKKLSLVGKKCYLLLDCSYIHEHSKTINSVAGELLQRKWLTDGRITFTKKYRRFGRLKSVVILLAHYISVIVTWIVNLLKQKRND